MGQAVKLSTHRVAQEAIPVATVTHRIGNTTITVVSKSDVILMTPQERGEWFRKKLEEGDPVCNAIADTVTRILTRQKSIT